jgi:DNA gyrase subunit A
LLTVGANEEITAIVSFKDVLPGKYLFMATARGVVKKVEITGFANAKTRGVNAIKLDDGDRLVSAMLTDGNDEIMLISRQGQALRTHENAVRSMGRASRGVCGLKLDSSDELSGVLRVVEGETMLLLSEYGYGKRVDFSEFTSHGRATGGQRIYMLGDKTGELVSCVNVCENEEIMCITSQGQSIRVKVDTIRVMGRSAQGVRIVNIEKPDFVVGVDRIVNEDVPPTDTPPAEGAPADAPADAPLTEDTAPAQQEEASPDSTNED